MFASVRCYFVHKTSASDLAQRVDDDFAALMEAQPGFVSYEFLNCGGAEAMTLSVFREAAQAEASRELARWWTNERLQDMELTITEALRGEIVVTRGAPAGPSPTGGGRPPYAAVRRYRLLRGDVGDFLRTVTPSFAGLVAELDGFLSYRAMDCGGQDLASVSVFRDEETAIASEELAAQTMRRELAEFGIDRTAMVGGGDVVVARIQEEQLQVAARA
jgi:hypothetical protein